MLLKTAHSVSYCFKLFAIKGDFVFFCPLCIVVDEVKLVIFAHDHTAYVLETYAILNISIAIVDELFVTEWDNAATINFIVLGYDIIVVTPLLSNFEKEHLRSYIEDLILKSSELKFNY